jgi:hypothetical protein
MPDCVQSDDPIWMSAICPPASIAQVTKENQHSTSQWEFGIDVLNELLARIQSTFPADACPDIRARGFRSGWTMGIKRILCEMARERQLLSRCSGPADGREFLLDLLWIEPLTKRCLLAALSELGNIGEIADDLEKLLYTKSAAKILICDPWPYEEFEATAGRLLEQYGDYQPGEHYLVLNLGSSLSIDGRPSKCSPILIDGRVHGQIGRECSIEIVRTRLLPIELGPIAE